MIGYMVVRSTLTKDCRAKLLFSSQTQSLGGFWVTGLLNMSAEITGFCSKFLQHGSCINNEEGTALQGMP